MIGSSDIKSKLHDSLEADSGAAPSLCSFIEIFNKELAELVSRHS